MALSSESLVIPCPFDHNVNLKFEYYSDLDQIWTKLFHIFFMWLMKYKIYILQLATSNIFVWIFFGSNFLSIKNVL